MLAFQLSLAVTRHTASWLDFLVISVSAVLQCFLETCCVSGTLQSQRTGRDQLVGQKMLLQCSTGESSEALQAQFMTAVTSFSCDRPREMALVAVQKIPCKCQPAAGVCELNMVQKVQKSLKPGPHQNSVSKSSC